MFLRGTFGCLALKARHGWTLPEVLFHLGSHMRPEEPIMHEVKQALQAQMANLIMASSESNLPLCSWQNQLNEGLL